MKTLHSEARVAYKIFDLHDDNGVLIPKTLFHGLNRSRKLPLDVWLPAHIKWAKDGSGQKSYRTGFHAYATLADVKKWLDGAKNLDGRVVMQVRVARCRWKPRAVRKTILANWLWLDSKDWTNRVPARAFLAAF